MAVMIIIFKNSVPAKQETQPVSENQPVNLFGEIVALDSEWWKHKNRAYLKSRIIK
jgi:hypothetical protein